MRKGNLRISIKKGEKQNIREGSRDIILWGERKGSGIKKKRVGDQPPRREGATLCRLAVRTAE